MKLRRNECVQFIVHCSAVVVSKPSSDSRALAFSMSKIRTIHAAIASSVHKRRCASCLTGRFPSEAGNAESATTYLPTAVRSSLTISARSRW